MDHRMYLFLPGVKMHCDHWPGVSIRAERESKPGWEDEIIDGFRRLVWLD